MATRSQLEIPPAGERIAVSPRGEPATGRRSVRIVLLLLGLAVLAVVFRSVGWPAIASNLARIGPWFLALAALYGAAQLAFALGWGVLFDGEAVSFRGGALGWPMAAFAARSAIPW